MCGIVGVFNYKENKEMANDKALEIMDEQLRRGTEGFGSVFIDDKKQFVVKRATGVIKAMIDINLTPSRMILIHHRQPTSSTNKILQTHPIVVENKKLKHGYLVIHNGIVRNHEKLKEDHKADGYVYTTDDGIECNDSESLAIEVAKFIENKTKQIETTGTAAFVALQYDLKSKKALQVFYGKNDGAVLRLAKSRNILRLSSEGGGESIKSNVLYHFDLEDFAIKKQTLLFAKDEWLATGQTAIGFKTVSPATEAASRYRGNHSYNYDDDDDDDDIVSEWDVERAVDELKDTINEELDASFKKMYKAEAFWKVKIEEEVRRIIGVAIIEMNNAYDLAFRYYSKEAVEKAEEADAIDAEKEKIVEQAADEPHEVAKYHAR